MNPLDDDKYCLILTSDRIMMHSLQQPLSSSSVTLCASDIWEQTVFGLMSLSLMVYDLKWKTDLIDSYSFYYTSLKGFYKYP